MHKLSHYFYLLHALRYKLMDRLAVTTNNIIDACIEK